MGKPLLLVLRMRRKNEEEEDGGDDNVDLLTCCGVGSRGLCWFSFFV